MTSAIEGGFISSLPDGMIGVKEKGESKFELWMGTYKNPRAQVFTISANDLEVLANNLLDLIKPVRERR